MEVNNGVGLRESLERLDTASLDELLRLELERETPDADVVRLIMSILEQRDRETPREMTPRDAQAWQRYQQRMASIGGNPKPFPHWITAAASLVVIIGLLFAVVPQQAQAETFWQMIQRWSSAVLDFLGAEDQFRQTDYVFETDNPGLQQVYDAAVDVGISDPVVPMWLPAQSELAEIVIQKTPALQSVRTRFSHQGREILYKLDMYMGETAHEYYIDDTHVETYERNGTTYNISQNADWWVVIWTKDNIECFLTLDCQEDTLRRILESIYVTED